MSIITIDKHTLLTSPLVRNTIGKSLEFIITFSVETFHRFLDQFLKYNAASFSDLVGTNLCRKFLMVFSLKHSNPLSNIGIIDLTINSIYGRQLK